MEKVFLALVWKDEKTPLFHVKSPSTNTDEYIHIPSKIHLKNLHERFCVGTTNPLTMEYENCSNKVDSNNCQCNKCKFMYEFYKCVRCHGDGCNVHNNTSKTYCDTPHWVYLAYFPGGKIKVGTASAQRKETRLLDQGALHAIYIAHTPDGKTARQIENTIVSLGTASMVSTSYKMKNLVLNENLNQIEGLLLNKYDELKNGVSQCFATHLIPPEFKTFPNILNFLSKIIESDTNSKQEQFKFVIEKNIDIINGDYLFAVGKILVIKKENEIKLIDTKKLEGFNFEFKENSPLKIYGHGGDEIER